MNKENQKSTKKLSGFYIALCSCVLMIGIAGYLTEKHTDNSEVVMNTEPYEIAEESVFSNDIVAQTDSILSTEPPAEPASEDTENAGDTENSYTETAVIEEIEEFAVDNPDVLDNAVTVSSEQPAFILPVTGEVLEPFTDVLSYNNALDDWRTHGGIDIAAEKGCSVQSVAQGVIDAIYDNEMGRCVEISHTGNFVTKYMGLEGLEDISVGQEINSGEVIGTVGDCKGENVTQPHLHFEMTKDSVAVNPSDFLPHD